jgi:ADP-heptose:LPS heptosyltransferase
MLGDTLLLTPLLAKLRASYPTAEILLTASPVTAPLYQKQPYGVKALAYDPRNHRSLRALFQLRGFDLAIVPGDNRYSWLARALGARWVAGFAGDRPASKNWLMDQLTPYPDTPATWGEMAAALIDGPPPAPYKTEDWPTPDCRPFALPTQPYCVLHVGASTVLKLWSPEKWRALIEFLTKCGLQIVSIGHFRRNLSQGCGCTFTHAMPAHTPAFANSVISCGSRAPSGFVSRSAPAPETLFAWSCARG